MELPKSVALVVAIALVALGALGTRWLQRMEARREEVRHLMLLAAAEVEEAEKEEEAYYYARYSGFVHGSELPEAPSLWTAQEVAPTPKEVEAEAEAAAGASPLAGMSVCALCSKPTIRRCKQCRSVYYCTIKCQVDHWRLVHKDECHLLDHGATQDDTPNNLMAGVELKDMPSEASSTFRKCDGNKEMLYSQFTGERTGLEPELEQSNKQAPGADNHESLRNLPSMPTVDKVPSTHSGPCARPESSGVMPNNSSTAKKYARQQTSLKAVRNYPTESALFLHKNFAKLYSFDKFEMRPFGLCNLGNSCYANAVIQCLAFTRPLTAYLLEGYHSQNCSKNEWCFMCELESLDRGHKWKFASITYWNTMSFE